MIVHMAICNLIRKGLKFPFKNPKSTSISIIILQMHTHALDIVIMPSCFPRLSGRGSGSRSGHSGRCAVLYCPCASGSADSRLGLVEKQKVLIDWQFCHCDAKLISYG